MPTAPLTSSPLSTLLSSPFQYPGSRQRINKTVLEDTITGLRISAIDGTAFVDNAADLTTYADGNHQLTITDSAGKTLVGVLGSVGSGETLGSELVTNGVFTDWTDDSPDGWNVVNQDVANYVTQNPAGQAQFIGDNTSITQLTQTPTILHRLLHASIDLTAHTSGGIRFAPGTGTAGGDAFITSSTVGTHTGYRTAIENFIRIHRNSGAYNFTVDNVTAKQVTAPSTSGALITASRHGAQSFASRDADFAYNAASYAVVVKRIYL